MYIEISQEEALNLTGVYLSIMIRKLRNNNLLYWVEDGADLTTINHITYNISSTDEDNYLKESVLKRINRWYEIEVSKITSSIPDSEKQTWTKQEEEARKYILDNLHSTPFIDGIVSLRPKYTKDTLVLKIIEKSDLFTSTIGQLTGERQRREDLVNIN